MCIRDRIEAGCFLIIKRSAIRAVLGTAVDRKILVVIIREITQQEVIPISRIPIIRCTTGTTEFVCTQNIRTALCQIHTEPAVSYTHLHNVVFVIGSTAFRHDNFQQYGIRLDFELRQFIIEYNRICIVAPVEMCIRDRLSSASSFSSVPLYISLLGCPFHSCGSVTFTSRLRTFTATNTRSLPSCFSRCV